MLKTERTKYLWHPSDAIQVRFSVEMDSVESSDVKVIFADNEEVHISDPTVDDLAEGFKLQALPGSYELPIDELRINDRKYESSSLKLTIVSPFYHRNFYNSPGKGCCFDPYLMEQDFYFPRRVKWEIGRFVNSGKEVLWIHGLPGCGKSFLLNYYVRDRLEKEDVGIISLTYPQDRWRILAQIVEKVHSWVKEEEFNEEKFKFTPKLQDLSMMLDRPGVWYILIDNAYKTSPDCFLELLYLALNPPEEFKPNFRLIILDSRSFEEYLEKEDINPSNEVWGWLDQEDVETLHLKCWDRDWIEDLVEKCVGSELSARELDTLYAVTGGHPYLLASQLDKWPELYRDSSVQRSSELSDISEQGKTLFRSYRDQGFLTDELIDDFRDAKRMIGGGWSRVRRYKELEDLGLIVSRRRGASIEYHVTTAFAQLAQWI